MTTSGANKPHIVFFGNERLATGVETSLPTITTLLEQGFDIAAIVSSHQKATSRKHRELEIQTFAGDNKIPFLTPRKVKDIEAELVDLQADAGVLVAFGQIVPQSIIDIFPAGIINVHPSLLPKHRGPTPIESVILEGADKTGVSVMSLVKAMDAGPVYAQSEIELKGSESKQELANSLGEIGAQMIVELLPDIVGGLCVAIPQDESAATYDSMIQKSDGHIDWNKPAEAIEREIRAYAEWPKSYTKIASKNVVITSAITSSYSGEPGAVVIDNSAIHICCVQNSLQIIKLKPAGKKEMAAESFLAGHKNLLS